MTPVTLLVEGSPDAVPRGPVLLFPVFMLFPIVWTFAGFLRFSLVCFLVQRALPLCLLLLLVLCCGFLRSGFGSSSAGISCSLLSVATPFYGVSDSFGSLVPFATWSPFGTCQGCCGLHFSQSSGLLPVVVPFLYESPFCSFTSFASKVL